MCRNIQVHKSHGIYDKKEPIFTITFLKKVYNKQCNHHGKLQMMLQETGTGHMLDRTFLWPKSCSCKNDISFPSRRTQGCGLELFCTLMVHEIFAHLVYW